MRLAALALILCGCVRAAGTPEADEGALNRELAGRVVGPPQDCVSAGAGLAVRDRQTLVAERGGTLWVNRLAAACPGIDPVNRLEVNADGSRYCRGDRVRGVAPGQSIPGRWCVLGRFTPYRRP